MFTVLDCNRTSLMGSSFSIIVSKSSKSLAEVSSKGIKFHCSFLIKPIIADVILTATTASAVYPGQGTTEARTASTPTSTLISPATTTVPAAHHEIVAQTPATPIKTLSTQPDMEHQTIKIEPPNGHLKIINNEHPHGVMTQENKTKKDATSHDLDNQPETLEKGQQGRETGVPHCPGLLSHSQHCQCTPNLLR